LKSLKTAPFRIDPFTSTPIQIVNEKGESLYDPAQLDFTEEWLLKLYRDLVLTREIDKMGWILARQGKAGFYISIGGQEASHVASLYALEEEDWVMPYYRTMPSTHVRGAKLSQIFAQVLGTNLDPSKGRQMPGHFGSKAIRIFVIGSTVGLGHVTAVGVAMAIKYRKENKVVISYGGEGSTSEGHFHSAMNFAGVYRLPLVIFIHNNQYAISVPRRLQTASETLAIKAKAYGFEGYFVDGNDPLAVYLVTKKATQKARGGGGPTLIEALTYRFDPHSSSDDDSKYRPKEEVEEWKKKDAILRMRKLLERLGIWDEEKERELLNEISREIDKAVEEAESAGAPDPSEMFEEVYEKMPWYLREEKEELERERGGE
jgi:2-oxoisovalerate dehydrogenase E1 component alpha subunit